MSEKALVVSNVTVGYDRTTVLRGVSLEVPAGAVVALLGPNGAGKTTLLKTVSGSLTPTSGSVEIFGQDVTAESPAQRARHKLCHIPEGRGIFRSLTVQENLELQTPRSYSNNAIDIACDAFPILRKRLQQQAGTMSGGEQQMLAMARAYISEPRLVLVDEASLGLAPIIVDAIFAFLKSITERGASLLIVDQFVFRALDMASHAYVMNHGEITFSGTSEELLKGDVFEQYLGGGANSAH